jgi:GalNAc5-diNAcBac-PP-undecaprenol beta-1,3-glucosyltransferase
MKFTVLIPTHNSGSIIRYAIDSVLSQTVSDFELLIVADGAPAATIEVVKAFAARDGRLRLFEFEKGERHGEAHRHAALDSATGDVVCYLGDDDIWFPDHLETMAEMLANADFAHTRHTYLHTNFTVQGLAGRITDPEMRRVMVEQLQNIFGPTVAGHRLDAYRRLSVGWSPAPPDVWTDLHMWRKWIVADGIRFCASPIVTTLHVPHSLRQGMDDGRRALEVGYWREAFRSPEMRQALRDSIQTNQEPVALRDVVMRAQELQTESMEHRLRSIQENAAREMEAVKNQHAGEATRANERATVAEATLDQMRTSMTWRWTAPLRDIAAASRRLVQRLAS